MLYRALGPLEVVGDDGRPVAIGGTKPRALLARLLIERGRPVGIERLADDLWAMSPPSSAAATLHAYVSRLRRVLPQGALVTEGSGYALRTEPGEVDCDHFEAGVQDGRRALAADDSVRAATLLGDALRLWRGPALPELADCDAGRAESARLQEIRLAAEEDRFEAELKAGRHDDALADLEAAVKAEPLRERRWSLLMRALYRAGRQADALRRYQDLRLVLAEELGIDPSPELTRLEHAILVHDPSLDAIARARTRRDPRRRLPTPVTSFVGRDVETAELEAAVQANRLVTVVGPGGVGKTRLALELARARHADDLTERVGLVELASVTDPAVLPGAIAAALDADEPGEDGLIAALDTVLGDESALLVLDNCEHLVEACAQVVDEVLRGVPGLHVLATSREPLGVAGEAVWRLSPMPTHDAVELFRARSGEVGRTDDLDLAAICERLDGLPLAIELAAARLRSMSLEQLAAGLGDRFRLLGSGPRTGPVRHRTLRALIEWSYELLPPDDQTLFAVLSGFSGSFDAPAVESICRDVGSLGAVDAVVRLADLADKSLVVLEPGNRYRMLETIREFAAELLQAEGIADATRAAHLAWFAQLASDAAGRLRSVDQADWLRRCDAEHPNLRAAIEWAVLDSTRAPLAMRMATQLFRFWLVRSHVAEGRRLLERALDIAEEETVDCAWAHLRAGGLTDRQGDVEATRMHQEAALRLARRLRLRDVEALALSDMGTAARDAGDVSAAIGLAEQAVAAARDGDSAALGVCLCELASSHLGSGRFGRARELYDEARPLLESVGDLYGLSVATGNLGLAAYQQGDMEACRRFSYEARALYEQLGDRNGVAVTLAALAQAEQAERNFDAADEAVTASLAILREVGAPVHVSIVLGIAAEIRVERGLDPSDLVAEKLERDVDTGFIAGEATALVVRARHEARMGDPSAAATIANAVERAEASGNEAVVAGALLAAGDVYLESGRHAEARSAYEAAVPILRELGQDARAAHAIESLAAITETR